MLTIAEARKDLVKKNTLSTSFFLNDTAVVLYIISDSSIPYVKLNLSLTMIIKVHEAERAIFEF
jgi:hypothetical protein